MFVIIVHVTTTTTAALILLIDTDSWQLTGVVSSLTLSFSSHQIKYLPQCCADSVGEDEERKQHLPIPTEMSRESA